MNKTYLDRFSSRFSQGLAATVLVTGVAGFAGTAQAETVASAAALLEDSSTGAVVSTGAIAVSEPSLFVTEGFSPEAIVSPASISESIAAQTTVAQTTVAQTTVAQTTTPTPLEAPNQLPPPGQPVPQQPSEPGRTGAPVTPPTPGSTPGTQPTPLNSPNQLPPPGQPIPGQPSEPGRTGAPVTPPTPGSTPGTQPTPLDSPNQLPPPGQPIPGQPSEPSPTVPTTPPPATTTPTPPPTTRPAPPPRQEGGIQPGRATATGASYVGAGFNIGIGEGGSAVGDGSFALFSKIGLTQLLSIRPAVLFSDNATFLIPVTFDFIPLITPATRDVGEVVGLRVSPYVGGGAAISTGDDSSVDFLLTGGVDVPVSDRLTATAQLNLTFIDNTAVGLLLGLGYNF